MARLGDWITFEVINWDKYNPRKDRKHHAWFRVENGIASEPKFHELTAAERFVAVCLLAEFSKARAFAEDAAVEKPARVQVSWLASQLRVKADMVRRVFEHLLNENIVRLPPGDQPVSNGSTTYERTNVRTNATHSHGGCLFEIWNKHRGNLPEARELNADRRKKAAARWDEHPEGEYWVGVIERMAQSKFCNGAGSTGWRADFDFLLQPATATKVLEGKYDDRGPGGSTLPFDPSKDPEVLEYERIGREAMGGGL